MQICDYGISSISWTAKHDPTDTRKPGHMPWDNTIRILIDSRCEIVDKQTGASEWYYLITPCRTEWMYRDDMLWKNDPNLEFVGIYSSNHYRHGHVQVQDKLRPQQDLSVTKDIAVGLPNFHPNLSFYNNTTELIDDNDVIQATLDLQPIIATTQIQSLDGKTQVNIEYPIKTMNFVEEKNRFQVDTGPILFPDFDLEAKQDIDKLQLAFVCYNNRNIAEFVSRVPTVIENNTGDSFERMEYSNIKRLNVSTKLFGCTN